MAGSAKILIVDDSKVVLMATRMALERAGYSVVTRCDAVGSTAEIMRERPDLVLLDVDMPLLSGVDLVQSIKRREGLRDVIVLLFSAKPASELRQLALLTGANGFLPKPKDLNEVVVAVDRWLALRTHRPLAAASAQ